MPRPEPPRPFAAPTSGFTLLELIIVITIIGILSTVVVLRLVDLPDRARVTAANADMEAILDAAKMIHAFSGSYPATIREMVNHPDGGLEKYPIDPWGTDYDYAIVDGRPRVTCLGADKAEGGEGFAADIIKPLPVDVASN